MKKTLLCDGWTFEQKDLPLYYKTKPVKKTVKLPHDYAITTGRSEYALAGPGSGFYQGGSGSYSRFMEFKEGEHSIIQVDGAFAASRVFFNRELCEFHPHGYAPYLTDLTPFAVPGKPNKLLITTDDSFYSRWYSGAGLYRDVFLWTGDSVRVEPWDYFAYTKSIRGNKAQLVCEATVSCDITFEGYAIFALEYEGQKYESRAEIKYGDKNNADSTAKAAKNSKQGKVRIKIPLCVPEPRLWSPDSPALYDATLCVLNNKGEEFDRCEWKFGIRTLEISAEKGLLLNGKPIKLCGGCIHHDHGGIGAVSLPAAEERRITKMKEVGYNAIRSSHNPPSTALLEACDRLGMILMDELFDMWQKPKKHLDYSLFFKDYWRQDTENSVRRDRNHACVFSYSVGNEVAERDESYGGTEICREISAEIKKWDKTRPVTQCITGLGSLPLFTAGDPQEYAEIAAGCPVEGPDEKGKFAYPYDAYYDRTEKITSCLDIVGYNYQFRRYEKIHGLYPDRVFWGSETQVLHFYESWTKTAAHPYILGDFTWTAWDNLGEAGCGGSLWASEGVINGYILGKYPWRCCYQGDFDLAGFRRPQSYFRRALWQPDAELGLFTAHPKHTGESFSGTGWHWFDVSPSWTYEDEWTGKDTVCEAYTTADRVDFFVNGTFAASAVPEEAIARVTIPYEPGKLEAVAYRDGKEVTRAELVTSAEPAILEVRPEKKQLTADSRDLAYFDISLKDKNGNLIAGSGNEISVSVSGGTLISVFSGNPCNEDDYTSGSCHLFCGHAVAVVQTDMPGKITLSVISGNISSDAVVSAE